MRRLLIVFSVLAFLNMGLFLNQSLAITITYEASDQGGGVWQGSYRVVDYIFDKDYGFNIVFDYGLYKDISPVSHGGDWDVITWNPQLLTGGVEQAGAYDALALVNHASLTDPFVVQFHWLGGAGTAPGPQVFEVHNASTWTALTSGTIPAPGSAVPVPVGQPLAILLLICGLTGLLALRKESIVRRGGKR